MATTVPPAETSVPVPPGGGSGERRTEGVASGVLAVASGGPAVGAGPALGPDVAPGTTTGWPGTPASSGSSPGAGAVVAGSAPTGAPVASGSGERCSASAP